MQVSVNGRLLTFNVLLNLYFTLICYLTMDSTMLTEELQVKATNWKKVKQAQNLSLHLCKMTGHKTADFEAKSALAVHVNLLH